MVHPASLSELSRLRIVYRGASSCRGSRTMTIRVRALSPEEVGPLTELAHSHKRGAGLVRRAQIIMQAVQERLSAPEIAARTVLGGETVRFWIKRFNARGLNGLAEDMRSGRPPTYCAEERSRVIRPGLRRSAGLGLPV